MRNARHRTWLCVVATAMAIGAGSAYGASAGRDGPYRVFEGTRCELEERLFADADDERLDGFSLLGAALVASGVEERTALETYERRVDELAKRLQASGGVQGSPRQRAQAVFEFMHREILRGGYRLDCTDLRIPFDAGQFNCVSAAVLFDVLACRFGLDVCGLEVPGHAMSCVVLPEGNLEIETTCPRWFQLLGSPQKQAQAVKNALGRESQGGRAAYRMVSDVELVAAIYYNRGVDLLAAKRFAEALAANAKALRLDPQSETAHGNLLAVLNNWAIWLSGRGDHQRAVELLRQGLALAPDYGTFAVNYVHVCHQWSEDLCGEDRFEEAAKVLSTAAKHRPEEAYFRQALANVYRRWARSVLATGDAEPAPFAASSKAKPGRVAPAHSGPPRPGASW